MDLPDDDWEDEAFIDEAFIDETYRLAEGSTAEGSTAPQTPAAGSTAPTVKTGGMNLRCVCWLMNLIILAVLCAAGSYSLKQPEPSKFMLWLSLNVLGKFQTPLSECRRQCTGCRIWLCFARHRTTALVPFSVCDLFISWFVSRLLVNRFGNFTEICKVLALTPIIYPLGPMHTLQPAAAADGLTRFLLPNLLWYILPFFVGLNWTHLQRWKPLRGISLSPAGLQELAKRPKAAVVVAASLPAVLCAVIYHVRLMASAPHPYLYVAYVVVLVVSVAVVSWVVRATHEVHLHHFFTTCVLIPLTSFRNPVSAACQALLGGIYIEGAARFGMG